MTVIEEKGKHEWEKMQNALFHPWGLPPPLCVGLLEAVAGYCSVFSICFAISFAGELNYHKSAWPGTLKINALVLLSSALENAGPNPARSHLLQIRILASLRLLTGSSGLPHRTESLQNLHSVCLGRNQRMPPMA